VTMPSFSQNENTAIAFLKTIKYESHIETYYGQLKTKILKHRPLLFEEYNIDKNNSEIIKSYDQYLENVFTCFKEDAKNRIINIYSRYDKKDLDSYMKMVSNGERFDTIKVHTNFSAIVENIIKEHNDGLIEDIPYVVRKLRAVTEPLKLLVIVDNDTIEDLNKLEIGLELVTTNDQFKKVNILNKETSEIKLPENLKYKEAKYLILTYENKTYDLFEKIRIPREVEAIMSEELKDSYNALAKECWLELLYWELRVNHNPKDNPDYKYIAEPGKYQNGLISFSTRIGTYIEK